MNPPTNPCAQAPLTCAKCDIHRGLLQIPWDFIARSLVIILLTVCPAIICAYLGQASANWHLFERSGSMITIIGLLIASRRYIEHSATDLVVEHASEHAGFRHGKVLSDILDARRGLTLSAFGTLIWGWGIYLRWWSFGVLALWMAFVIYRAFHDPVLQRLRDDAGPLS